MNWKCIEFKQMTAHELYAVLRIRSTVFVVEYAHIHLDMDNKDEDALHIFAIEEEQGSSYVAAYARLMPGDDQDPEITIDRILTHVGRRDDDTHDQLVAHALSAARALGPNHPIFIDAPAHQEAFYEGFGFRKTAGPFLEHGVPYISMAWQPSLHRQHEAPGKHNVQWISPLAKSLHILGR